MQKQGTNSASQTKHGAIPRGMGTQIEAPARGFLKRGKKVFLNGSFAKRPRVAHMFNHGWWRLAVGGGGDRQLAVADWRLAAVGG